MELRFSERRLQFENLMRAAVALDHPYPFRPVFAGRAAAVLVLVGIRESMGTAEVLVTRRPESLETHKGQYALPGGMRDSETETSEATALRETNEEMGIPSSRIEVFGRLPPIWTPSGFNITPVVGLLRDPIERITVVPSPAEIDFWFWCPLDRLRAKGVYSSEARTFTYDGRAEPVSIDVYQVDDHRIWGATGAMLRNFIARLEKIETS